MTMAVVTGAFVALEQIPAGGVVLVGPVGRRDERARIDDEHLVSPESLG